MENLHNIAVYESKGSERVIKFLTEKDVQRSTVDLIENGTLVGLYFNENSNIVAADIWGYIHTEVLK